MMNKILLVDDEIEITEINKRYLLMMEKKHWKNIKETSIL